jgi:choline dehydrogenase-like flavoprotein
VSVFATKEVILSAGTFDTPKILMLSGIGPREELEKHGIKKIQHLPGVGRSMKDHAAIFMTALMKPGFTERMAFETDAVAFETAAEQWKKNGTGRLAIERQSLLVMFNKLPEIYDSEEFRGLPEDVKEYLQRDTVPTYEATFGGPKFPPTVEIPLGMEYLGITVFGMNSQGEGTVTLDSSSPMDAMVIDPNALTHPFDRRVMIDSLTETLNIFKSTKQYKEGFVSWLMGPKSETKEDLEAFLKEQTLLVWHASGTVKMGKEKDESACVDSNFKVRGFEGLRVADMSVAPVNIK